MTAAHPTLFDRFRQMPRALQWAAMAVLALALFMVWDTYLWPATTRIARSADSIQNQAIEIRQATKITPADEQTLRATVPNLGPVALPEYATQAATELNDAVTEVLKHHQVTNVSLDFRPKGKLPPGTLAGVTKGKRIERLVGDLKFIASPEETAAIIAELESSPVIAAINSVRIVKDASRKVKVNLSAETWVLSSETTRGTRS